jgi:uncharacterized protein (DUF305 family)
MHKTLLKIAALAAGLAVVATLAVVYGKSTVSGPASTKTMAAPGPVDIGFAQFMSLHHQQAIGMANLMLDGRPTPLAPMARSIAATQLLELGEMRGWLGLWGQALQPANLRDMSWMLVGSTPPDEELLQYLLDCQRSETGMSGLATDADLNRLRMLEGRERDAHFLKLMLAHHQGGLPMARFAAQQAQVPVVRELASRIVLEQSHEVALILRTQQAMAATAP